MGMRQQTPDSGGHESTYISIRVGLFAIDTDSTMAWSLMIILIYIYRSPAPFCSTLKSQDLNC